MQRGRFIAAFIILLILMAGCWGEPEAADYSSDGCSGGASARIVITAEFGQVLILDQTIDINSEAPAMEALKQIADVETKYGGGFIQDIDKTRSQYGNDRDWFFGVNGIQAKTGALDYRLCPGDTARFDFHSWGFRMFTPAAIGAFPEPFLHGYGGKVRPTYIVYEGGFKQEAGLLEEKLQGFGVKQVSPCIVDELAPDAQKSGNLILIGNMNSQLIEELNGIWDRMGFFARFENGKLLVFDDEGNSAFEFGAGAGLIQATQNPWNPKGIGACENVVWMISGVGDTGVKAAIDVLLNQDEKLEYALAAVIASDGIILVPPI